MIRKGDLVAVVSPDEWEAISAARSRRRRRRNGPSGLGCQAAKVSRNSCARNNGKDRRAAAKRQVAHGADDQGGEDSFSYYEQPYVSHAPIGPFLAVADVRSDGSATVWTHSAQSQGLRARIAYMLGTSAERVVVRWLDHSGQYGRTTFGGDGAESDAVILSQLTGKTCARPMDLAGGYDLVERFAGAGFPISKRVSTRMAVDRLHSSFYSPHMFDPRPLGALLAGMPCSASKPGGWVATEWLYDKIRRLEDATQCPTSERNQHRAGCAATSCARLGSANRTLRWKDSSMRRQQRQMRIRFNSVWITQPTSG